jgi:hypothetical protein
LTWFEVATRGESRASSRIATVPTGDQSRAEHDAPVDLTIRRIIK